MMIWKAPSQSKIVRHFNRVDVLINMAGALVSKEFMNIDDKEARLMMETNFFGPATVIRIVKPLMPEGSHIVNISSMGGFQGSVKFAGLLLQCLQSGYCVSFRVSGRRIQRLRNKCKLYCSGSSSD